MSRHQPAEDHLGDLIRSATDDTLVRGLRADVERMVRSVIGVRDPHLVQTAANDALLAIVRHRRGFRGDCRASTWLYVVARRAALRAVGREQRQARRELRWAGDPAGIGPGARQLELAAAASEGPGPGAALVARELLQELVPNPTWRRIWLLYNDPELRLSHAEIAARTGRTPGTIAVTLSRVRALIEAAGLEPGVVS
jgi:DNA-directed RNA polymerase specialized sigma24 family protein